MTTETGVSPGVAVFEAATSLIVLTLALRRAGGGRARLLVTYVRKGADPFVEPPASRSAAPTTTTPRWPSPTDLPPDHERDRDTMELTTVWFALIAVLWVGYFCLEGFDFGVGMLLPVLARNETERRVMINTIGPVWDGNEVWVLVAGGATFAAFPEWYATLFSGFYLPLLLILVALIVRGLAFEYRAQARRRPVEGPLGPRHHRRLVRAGAAVGRRLRQHRRGRADRRRQGVHRQPLHAAQPLRPARRAGHADASSPPTARCSSRSRPTATSATGPATWRCGSARSPPCSPWSSWCGRS